MASQWQPWTGTKRTRLPIFRADDLLVLTVELGNLKVQDGALCLEDKGSPGFVVLHFPPQHLAEQVFEAKGEQKPRYPSPPVPAQLSGPSRLVFAVPSGSEPIPFVLEQLLDWSQRLQPSQVQSPASADEIAEPDWYQTAVEVPSRLVLSPGAGDPAVWRNAREPVTDRGRTELWHARLVGYEAFEETRAAPPVRVVWSPDYPDGSDHVEPFPTSLTAQDRARLVRRTHEIGKGPQPVPARALLLSALGAWLDLDGPVRPPPAGQGLPLRWMHRTQQGQDERVAVESKGFLVPTGHEVTLVQLVERVLEEPDDDTGAFEPSEGPGALAPRAGYLRKTLYVAVNQAEVVYPDDGTSAFRSIRLETRVTPPLDLGDDHGAFWIETGPDARFAFDATGCDWEGNESRMALDTVFCADEEGAAERALGLYGQADALASRRPSLDGQRVAVARADAAAAAPAGFERSRDDTTLELLQLELASGPTPPERAGGTSNAPFTTRTAGFEARVPLLKTFGVEASDWFALTPLAQDGNTAEVFAERRPPEDPGDDAPPIRVVFSDQADRVGGIAAPDLDVAGVSRLLGPVGDVALLRRERQDLGPYFAETARLLGEMPLAGVLAPFDAEAPLPLDALPVLRLEPGENDGEPELVFRFETTRLQNVAKDGYQGDSPPAVDDCRLVVRQGSGDSAQRVPSPDQDSKLALELRIRRDAEGNPLSTLSGELTNFGQQAVYGGLGLIVPYRSMKFASRTGEESKLDVDVAGIRPVGDKLVALQPLVDFFNGSFGDDPPAAPPDIFQLHGGFHVDFTFCEPETRFENFSIAFFTEFYWSPRFAFSMGFSVASPGNPFYYKLAAPGWLGMNAVGGHLVLGLDFVNIIGSFEVSVQGMWTFDPVPEKPKWLRTLGVADSNAGVGLIVGVSWGAEPSFHVGLVAHLHAAWRITGRKRLTEVSVDAVAMAQLVIEGGHAYGHFTFEISLSFQFGWITLHAPRIRFVWNLPAQAPRVARPALAGSIPTESEWSNYLAKFAAPV